MRKGKPKILSRYQRPSTVEEVISEAREYRKPYLDLSQRGLTELPSSLKRISHFSYIDLSENKMAILPESIGRLIELEELKLQRNNLIKLPKAMGNLSKLRILDLSENQLTEIPKTIGNLLHLQTLDLSRNEISELPEDLMRLKFLKELYLHGNPKLGIPIEILGASHANVLLHKTKPANPMEILEYYFRIRKGQRPLNEAKLILVGRGAVGKTSIVNRLIYNSFDGNEKKTEGISISEWDISLSKEDNVRLNVWDFGGQEIMHATHQFFLTQRSLYLLVLSGREGGEDKDAEYWLKLIDSFGNKSPVIIVLNKIKEQRFDLNRRALITKYPFIAQGGFIATDCKDAIGIRDLREKILYETNNLEHLRDPFPLSWFAIKGKLGKMGTNYLTFDEYRRVCSENGESDCKAQDILSTYLHNLGIVLNYKDDPRLQDTHVLNPHWVTKGIYKILNSNALAQTKGEISLQDLTTLLDSNEYPRSMHSFIFDLMKKFELCFSYFDEYRYLIPELLDKQEPEETATFVANECLNFQYDYPILPEGLLPRFIVRTHTLSEGLFRWRSGVILKFGQSKALVKADAEDKKVNIHVTGKTARQRCELLGIIRLDFERIHYDIPNLNPQAMVPIPDHYGIAIPYEDLLIMEQEGIKEMQKVVNKRVLNLNIEDLLTGVDLKDPFITERLDKIRNGVLRLFYVYSHKDEQLRDELENHLKLLERRKLITSWHDMKIQPGYERHEKINENLNQADIILLLISADFIASDYCYDIEMQHALERHNNNEAHVIPIIVRDVNWSNAPFAKLQVLPTNRKAVKSWLDRDEAWRNVSEGLEKVIKQIKLT